MDTKINGGWGTRREIVKSQAYGCSNLEGNPIKLAVILDNDNLYS